MGLIRRELVKESFNRGRERINENNSISNGKPFQNPSATCCGWYRRNSFPSPSFPPPFKKPSLLARNLTCERVGSVRSATKAVCSTAPYLQLESEGEWSEL